MRKRKVTGATGAASLHQVDRDVRILFVILDAIVLVFKSSRMSNVPFRAILFFYNIECYKYGESCDRYIPL